MNERKSPGIQTQSIESEDSPRHISKKTGGEKANCEQINSTQPSQQGSINSIEAFKSTCIFVKCNKKKFDISISETLAGEQIIAKIADVVKIPTDKMKLVHKGKLVNKDNVKEFVKNKALFQAIGEVAESEIGLDVRDIEVVMKQMHVERNAAIKALRKTGNTIDAIFELGNR